MTQIGTVGEDFLIQEFHLVLFHKDSLQFTRGRIEEHLGQIGKAIAIQIEFDQFSRWEECLLFQSLQLIVLHIQVFHVWDGLCELFRNE